MARWLLKQCRRLALLVLVVLVTVLVVRALEAWRGPPLHAWHTFEPHELTASQLDATDWHGYIAAENTAFDEVLRQVTQKLPEGDKVNTNRYYANAPIYPGHFATDWNRSYELAPEGTPVGAVVMLHGLTDSPYSMRHIAQIYRDKGFFVVVLRLPGHGTVPAGLSHVQWQDWSAATRLAVREARAHVPPNTPLHLVGYSNGGALAVKYALDALEDHRLARPDRLILISPMIGLTRFARFAGVAGWPAVLPAFAQAAWLDVVPEYNPFKYNSFPVNAAKQAYLLTDVLQSQLQRLARSHQLDDIAPVLAFQSVMDYTVSAPAVMRSLFALLPDNGSEVVLFDVNRDRAFDVLMRPASFSALARMLPKGPQRFRITVLKSVDPDDAIVASSTPPHETAAQSQPLSLVYPRNVFSMSHLALPFPPDDSLYGTEPTASEFYGVHLGTAVPRGERGALVLNLDTMLRITSNPFFAYIAGRIREQIAQAPPPHAHASMTDSPPPTDEEREQMQKDLDRAVEEDGGDAHPPR